MRTLQAWMGHEDIQTTNLYAHYAPAFDEAKRMTQAFRSLRENPVMGESQLASNSASTLSADTVV
jgi:hypothetical protein